MVSKRSSKKRKEKNHVKHDKEEAKKKRLSVFMGSLIAIIMISSVFGVMFYGYSDNSNTITRYGKFKFTQTDLGYELKYNGELYYFELLPDEVKSINVSKNIVNSLRNSKALIITSDPNTSYKEDIALSAYNMNLFLTTQDKLVGIGYNRESEDNGQVPYITCQNASSQYLILDINEANETDMTFENNCIKLQFGNSYQLRQVTTKMLFDYIGVFDE